MTKQQIIQRLDLIKAEIIFPNCHDDLPPIHRLGRVSQQLQDLIGDIEIGTEPISHEAETSCGPPKENI